MVISMGLIVFGALGSAIMTTGSRVFLNSFRQRFLYGLVFGGLEEGTHQSMFLIRFWKRF